MKNLKCVTLWIFTALLTPCISFAATTQWDIIPEKSSLSFNATQNGAPVTGTFTKFTGQIAFSPDDLSDSAVTITVDMGHIETSYGEIGATLKTADWFDSAHFPTAVFKSKTFTSTGAQTYEAAGDLTIRDKTQPIVLTFKMNQYTTTDAVIEGSTSLKRNDFGVGQGDWASTDNVKNEVVVNFTLTAKAAKQSQR